MQMAEPTCLMRSFSQPSESSRDFKEGDSARCLGESISFGRYMSEPLAWEKWSAFSSNRYLEEAEKSSKPGSVAKMKAYFEAYYKSKTSRKRVVRDEEASNVAEHPSCPISNTQEEVDSVFDKPSNGVESNLSYSSSFNAPRNDCSILERSQHTGDIAPVNTMDRSVQLEVDCSNECSILEHTEDIAPVNTMDSCVQLELDCSYGLENSPQLEKEPSNDLKQSKCSQEVESSKEGDDLEKLNSKGISAISKPPISLEMKLLKKGDDNQERLNLKIKKPPCSNFRTLPYYKQSKLPKFSSKVVASQPRKEGFVASSPRNKQQGKDTLHLNAMPSTSIHKSNKFGSHDDLIKKSSQFVHKSVIENPLTPSAKIMRNKATPVQTPNNAFGKLKHTSATPRPEIGRSISTPGRSLPRYKARGQEVLQPSLIKARASITFTPFNFQTEERAAKRKEFFRKQQEKEAEKLQQPEKAKERVKTARNLLNSIGLNAKSTVKDSSVIVSSRQETRTYPKSRPLKQSGELKMKAGKKLRHENESPNIL